MEENTAWSLALTWLCIQFPLCMALHSVSSLHGFAFSFQQVVHSKACSCAGKQMKGAAGKRASEGVYVSRSDGGSDAASGQASNSRDRS